MALTLHTHALSLLGVLLGAIVASACSTQDAPIKEPLASGGSGGGAPPPPLCTPGERRSCYDGPGFTRDVGICKGGKQQCAEDGLSWSACEGEVKPQVEDCTKPEDEDCSGFDCAQPLWSMRAGDAAVQSVRGIEADMDNTVTVIGSFSGAVDVGTGPVTAAGIQDMFVLRIGSDHIVDWTKSYGGANGFSLMEVAGDKNADVLLAGTYESSFDFGSTSLVSATGGRGFIGKIHRMGGELWAAPIGKDEAGTRVRIQALTTDAHANVIVAGSFHGCLVEGNSGCDTLSVGVRDLFVVKLDSNGKTLWVKTFSDPMTAASSADAQNVALDAEDNILVSGTFQGALSLGARSTKSNPGAQTAFVAKLDATGEPRWATTFAGSGDQAASALAVTKHGHVIFAASLSTGANAQVGAKIYSGSARLLVGIDAQGTPTWSRSLGKAFVTDLVLDAAGHLVLAGSFTGSIDLGGGMMTATGDGADALIAKLDADGTYLWARAYGDAADQYGVGAAVFPKSQDIVLAGSMAGTADFGGGPLTAAGDLDVFLAELAP
jgi:hypothetical protein